jgi:hypothetical protein
MALPRDYDVARFVSPERAADRAAKISIPVTITKRGAFIRGRKD